MIHNRGFTLIELAVVLVIVTVLIGGLLVPLSAQIQARRIAETKKILEEAREAIIGYAMNNAVPDSCDCTYGDDGILDPSPSDSCPSALCPKTGTSTLTLPITRHYLPCPDLMENDPEPNLDNDGDGSLRDMNNGLEDRHVASGKTDECASRSGNLPWVTLGTGMQDAWGNHLRYVVSPDFANKASGFTGSGTGDIKICRSNGCMGADVAGNVAAAIISHGPNGWGARSIHGTPLKNPTSANELENTNGDETLVSRPPSGPDASTGEFDDLLIWISADHLRGRVCPAGGCP